ncbi:hypothetical protein [Coprobacter secundus]|jgi:hypothetical protein|uniref:Replicative DNA helicase n=1 Tax=Coprobacter secundus subsp. similis TaxID=2751153 RepID=A0A7G1HVZ3_9BACT|nr:hypothetical protein [Coprobacter secundus]BCI61817.1 hypothetical protein Cop2CBH44_01700 [Coprobacter secundus subsp. similis]
MAELTDNMSGTGASGLDALYRKLEELSVAIRSLKSTDPRVEGLLAEWQDAEDGVREYARQAERQAGDAAADAPVSDDVEVAALRSAVLQDGPAGTGSSGGSSSPDGLEASMKKGEEMFVNWADAIVYLFLEKVVDMLMKARDVLVKAAEESGNGDTVKRALETLNQEVNKGKASQDTAGDGEKKTDWKKVGSALKDVGTSTKAALDSFTDLRKCTRDVMKAVGTVVTATASAIDKVVSLSDTAGKSISLSAYMASESISTVEKASVVLAVVSAAIQAAMAVANLFSKDKVNEKIIKENQKEIDRLQRAYDRLGTAIERAYSYDASGMIEQQDELLRQQRNLIGEQMAAEKDKKNTDSSKMNEYQRQIDDIDRQLADNKDKAIEAILGTEVKEAISSFAEAYVDAWAQGNSAAAKSKDIVANILKNGITEAVKGRLSGPVNELMKYLSVALEGGLTQAEQAKIDEYEQKIAAEAELMEGTYGKYLQSVTDRQQQSDSGGFETMSQDTATELNGRFTALQYAGEVVAAQNREQTSLLSQMLALDVRSVGIADEIRTMTVNSYLELTEISNNTGNTVKQLIETNKKLDVVANKLNRL